MDIQKNKSLINELIQKIDKTQSTESNLGRPELAQIPEMETLVKKGEEVIPIILPYLQVKNPKRVAYLVHAISMIKHNDDATEQIRNIRDKILTQKLKTEWDYAAVGECNLMLNPKK